MIWLFACGSVVIRDADTFKLETAAALARQQEAATALRSAIAAADSREECLQYAAPLAVIDAYAENQARRALYLAGLASEDPGPSPTLSAPDSYCPLVEEPVIPAPEMKDEE